MDTYFRTEDLSVGYDGKALIRDICIEMEKGRILTLIGPNGAGKSTILKSITRQLALVRGAVYIDSRDVSEWSAKEMAKQVAVVLTDRIRPELMSSEEVVAMGRYPYTNMFGKLTPKDTEAVWDALERVHATDLAKQDFATLSDGQRQRILLARAICQEPDVLVLDEPTAYLDIRHKLELLEILRDMARNRNTTVILSLHEIDLAMKISDYLLCVKGDTVAAFGSPEKILTDNAIERLYGMENGSYNLLFGSVELAKPEGRPETFVVAGGGYGLPGYRMLQKKNIPFATGILFPNDVDYQVAPELSGRMVCTGSFEEMTRAHFEEAAEVMLSCGSVIDAGTPVGALHRYNGTLLELAAERGLPVRRNKDL